MRHTALAALALLALVTAPRARADLPPGPLPRVEPAPACVPGSTVRGELAAGTPRAYRALDAWERAWSPDALDRVLLDASDIARLNGRNMDRPETWQDVIAADRDLGRVEAELGDRFAHLREAFVGGGLVEDVVGSFGASQALARAATPVDELRVVVHPVDLRCVPSHGGFFRRPIDRDFDRNQCAELHPGELVRVALVSPDGRWQYVHAGHAVGWLEDATLTPPLSPAAARAYRDDGARAVVVDDWVETAAPDLYLRLGTDLPLLGRDDDVGGAWVLAPSALGLEPLWVPDASGLHEGFLPLTRRNALALVTARMGDPYGWGGVGGGRDCSRLLLDVMATFGVRLGRHSSVQAGSGALTRDVAGLSDEAKLAAIHQAGQLGVVFLYMPGHIMLYLGELDGRPWAASAISEYLVPCAGGGRETVRLDKVEVTTLELGRGTERTAFIERIATLAVFRNRTWTLAMIALLTHLVLAQLGAAAAPTGPGGVDVAALASCEDSLDVAIFQSPRRPDARAPMRVMIVSDQDLGAGVTVVEVAPDGAQREVAAEAFGGPPWGWVVIDAKPTVGTHRYALVAGGAVRACQDVEVRKSAGGGRAHTPGEAAWDDYIKWERDTENLYSLWVERLFLAPLEEDISWNPLHDVLRDPSRNLLYDHLGLDEDAGGKKGLKLAPDCADFPYFLRAYFAWKMGLPMAFRPCRRGNRERAPTCGDIVTNELTSDADTRVGAFKDFVRKLQGTVHSSSLRGVPEDEDSDFYPVKLNRRGLRPGTIYTDPYGHTMMVGRWYPQEAGKPGVLMAIDAQPDGTIGRRIFWKGSFMFPEDDALKGAGWKRFRPVRRTRGGHEELGNEAIGESVDYGDFSVEQWSRGQEGFYELMDEVINPEPLPPELALMMTIDALEQQVARRVESIDTGEQYVRSHPGKPVKMPDGPAIFVTAGPWEDYSTPARDLRILIAIDTVKAFPDRVRRYPSRFELAAGADMDAVVAGLREKLAAETGRRSITYTRTDGSKQTLTLAEVMARSKALEMAYNPNDCVEWRWGAPEGSDEASTCKRRAPEGQRDKMEREYRGWFERRYRPVE